MTIIVDVANVMGARADGWWKDRAGAALRLCREVAALAGRGLEAAEVPGSESSGVPGPDSAGSGLAGSGLAGSGLALPSAGELPHAGMAGSAAGVAGPDAGVVAGAGAGVTGPPQARRYPVWVLVLEGRAREAADSLPLEPLTAGSQPSGRPVTGGGSVNRQIMADSDGLVQVVLAPGSGDDAIAREAAELRGCCIVSTADRELRRRCEQVGAVVTGPRWLLRLL